MAWLPDGEKISKIFLVVLAQLTNVTDTRTDGRTDTGWRQIPRLCIASRGKNQLSTENGGLPEEPTGSSSRPPIVNKQIETEH